MIDGFVANSNGLENARTIAFGFKGECKVKFRVLIEGKLSDDEKKAHASFELQDQADLLIDFCTWQHLAVSKPRIMKGDALEIMSREKLDDWLRSAPVSRNLVVIALDKRSDPSGKPDLQVIDELEKFFREHHFRRIVIQQDRGGDDADSLRDSSK